MTMMNVLTVEGLDGVPIPYKNTTNTTNDYDLGMALRETTQKLPSSPKYESPTHHRHDELPRPLPSQSLS